MKITSPFEPETIEKLRAGDAVLISGVIYTARDAAHKRMVEAIANREPPPFKLKGQTVYYTGPSPARPGKAIGAAGPTTSSRMDGFTPQLLRAGLRAMIGKGGRSQKVRDAIEKYKAVYFITIGGAGALISKAIRKAEVIAYPELGAEAIMRLEAEDLPAIVAADSRGGYLFKEAQAKYSKTGEA